MKNKNKREDLIDEVTGYSWTDAKKSLPLLGGPCLVVCNEWGGIVVRKAIYEADTHTWTEWQGPKAINITAYVRYWMPQPKPPKAFYI